MNHREQLQIFINGLAAKGVSADRIKVITDTLMADDNTIQYFSGGTLAQNLLDQKLNSVRVLEDQIKTQQSQWSDYINRANTTLTQAENERSRAVQQATTADVAIKALAAQYNIPESEVLALYNSQQFQQQQLQQQQFQPSQQYNQSQQQLQAPTFQASQQQISQQQPRQQQQGLTVESLNEYMGNLVNGILEKDAISARHFELTGKPWNPTKASEYIRQQALAGRKVELNEAWRITEGIDQLEAAANEKAKQAERQAIEQEIRQKIASESNHIPTDARPNFGEARIASIFQQQQSQQQQQNNDQARKEQIGHYGRTAEATAAFHRLQQARRLGQPSPYEQASTANTNASTT